VEFKLEGPGIVNFMSKVTELMEAGTDALRAYAQRAVQEMKTSERMLVNTLQMRELNRQRQKMEHEIKLLEERKKKALSSYATTPTVTVEKPPEREKFKNRKALTPEEQTAQWAKMNTESCPTTEVEGVEAPQSEMNGPLKYQPFAALAIRVQAQQPTE